MRGRRACNAGCQTRGRSPSMNSRVTTIVFLETINMCKYSAMRHVLAALGVGWTIGFGMAMTLRAGDAQGHDRSPVVRPTGAELFGSGGVRRHGVRHRDAQQGDRGGDGLRSCDRQGAVDARVVGSHQRAVLRRLARLVGSIDPGSRERAGKPGGRFRPLVNTGCCPSVTPAGLSAKE